MEGRHSSSSSAIRNNVEDLGIGKPLRFWTFRDVRGSLSASAIQTVASGTGRGKSLLSPRRGRLEVLLPRVLRWALRLRGYAIGGP